ncbi:hypothetical protein BGW42_001371 [Actinomortierella wolfii]|nr:hypothetical protein BGW42_001371 [Actinomortierella wolfii]
MPQALKQLNAAQLVRNVLKSLPASMVISLNAWAVSAWLKATILINSQPRWLFRKKRWSEGEMRAISCYYLVVAYLMLRVVRVTSRLTKRPGRPYGDFFRNTRPLLGAVVLFSLTTMLVDEFVMFYILRKFGLEKRRILITGRPLDKDIAATVTDDDCCICYGAMLDDEDIADTEAYMSSFGMAGLMSKETDHVLENFCVVKGHVAHRGCIRKWYNYGPKGYRPMDAFRVFQWGNTAATGDGTNPLTTMATATATTATATLPQRLIMGPRNGLGWLLSLPLRHGLLMNEQLRIPLSPSPPPTMAMGTQEDITTTRAPETTEHGSNEDESNEASTHADETFENAAIPSLNHAAEILDAEYSEAEVRAAAEEAEAGTYRADRAESLTPPPIHEQPAIQEHAASASTSSTATTTNTQPQQQQQHHQQHDDDHHVLPPVPDLPPRLQENEYTRSRNAGRNTCPACRQPLILNFVDLAKGRQEMSRLDKLWALGHDLTKFNDWRGLVLRSAITAGWVGVTIVGGKLRMKAIDRSMARHQRNRGLASLSSTAAAAAVASAGTPLLAAAATSSSS